MKSRHAGFSLIEVLIALGIVAFMVGSVVGLLPSGIKVLQDSGERASAANLANSLCAAVRAARTSDGTNYTWSYGGRSYAFSLGAGAVTNTMPSLNIQGLPVTASTDTQPKLTAVLVVTPPADSFSEGGAVVGVAWPSAATCAWSGNLPSWSRAAGSVTVGMRFVPKIWIP